MAGLRNKIIALAESPASTSSPSPLLFFRDAYWPVCCTISIQKKTVHIYVGAHTQYYKSAVCNGLCSSGYTKPFFIASKALLLKNP